MGCDFIPTGDGDHIILCSRGRSRPKTCEACHRRKATVQCDGPPREGRRSRTCDRYLCAHCATHVDGADLDFCPWHRDRAQHEAVQGDLFR